jgi:hypothetical protein
LLTQTAATAADAPDKRINNNPTRHAGRMCHPFQRGVKFKVFGAALPKR